MSVLRFCGIVTFVMVGVAMAMLLMFLGACNALPPTFNYFPVDELEPYPRAVRWTYPEVWSPRDIRRRLRLIPTLTAPSRRSPFIRVFSLFSFCKELLPHQRHWFLVHVAQTRLIKGMYVASISQ